MFWPMRHNTPVGSMITKSRRPQEYVPLAQAGIKSSGGRFLAAGGKVTAVEGDAPKSRVVLQAWDSIESIQAWRNSPQYKEARMIGDKYAKFRAFAVEGVPQ
jgi:uncharacterized protein (DUF1330 family)